MVNLIITVIALAFFAAIMFAGSGYINFDSITNLKHKTEISSGLSQLNTGIGSYRLLYDRKPSSWSDIVPSLIGQPSLPNNLEWGEIKINKATGYNEVCITANLSDASSFDVLKSIQSDTMPSTLIIADSCGASLDVAPESYPTTKIITYYIR